MKQLVRVNNLTLWLYKQPQIMISFQRTIDVENRRYIKIIYSTII